jgi:hypothetical protein
VPAGPRWFAFLLQDLDFDFGDVLEIRGSFRISSGSFTGTGLEVFVGRGPSTVNGQPNPNAVGVLITGATIAFQQGTAPGTWAIRVTGNLTLLGLPGLAVSGAVTFSMSTASDQDIQVPLVDAQHPAFVVPRGTFSFTSQNTVFRIGDLITLGGTLALTRQADGTLDVALAPATLTVRIANADVVRLSGFGTFAISPVTGFRLQAFKVSDFQLFPSSAQPASALQTGSAPTLFLTADLGRYGTGTTAAPLRNAVVTTGQLAGGITVVLNPVNGVALRPETITDAAPEIAVTLNGTTWAVSGTPTAVPGAPNTWRYAFTSGPPGGATASGLVVVTFLPGSFSDESGATNLREEERFLVTTAGAPAPGPIATLASPANGAGVTANVLNSQRYLDITYTSLNPATPIDTAFLASGAPFRLTGSGLTGDFAHSGGRPVLVGAPLRIAGATGATSVTYRYFLRDLDPRNTLGVFQPGQVTVTFDDNSFKAGTAWNVAGLTQSFTIDASAPGAAASTGPASVGPLSLQGPSIGLADFGFVDGKVVLTIAVGVDRAGLAFGGATAAGQQQSSGVTVDLIGILGTFDLAVDVFALLGGQLDAAPTGKWNLRVASLEAHIPGVADLTADGIVVGYDPKGPANQELVRINSATITFPRFGITGALTPYQPGSGSVQPTGTATNDPNDPSATQPPTRSRAWWCAGTASASAPPR